METNAVRPEIIPKVFDRIQPQRPRLTRKRRKLRIKIKESILCRFINIWGICSILLPMYNIILDALRVHASEHTRSPAIDIMEQLMIQSIIRFLTVLTSSTPRKAKENPATRALMNADCLQISA